MLLISNLRYMVGITFVIIIYSCNLPNDPIHSPKLDGVWFNFGHDKIYEEIVFYGDSIFYQSEYLNSCGNETYRLLNDTLFILDNKNIPSELFKPRVSFINDSLMILFNINAVDTFRKLMDIHNVSGLYNILEDYWERKEIYLQERSFMLDTSGVLIEEESIIEIKRN